MQARISACVIAFNAERSIAPCLASLALCDELIVVDAHSTDRTREIARAHGARVIERDSACDRTLNRFAVNAASHDWILSLAAGERLTAELAAAIVRAKIHGIGVCSAYEMRIHATCPGNVPHGDSSSAAREVRLFDRRRAAFGSGEIPDRVITYGPVGRLKGNVLHESGRDFDRQVSKLGRNATLHPAWRFLRAHL